MLGCGVGLSYIPKVIWWKRESRVSPAPVGFDANVAIAERMCYGEQCR